MERKQENGRGAAGGLAQHCLPLLLSQAWGVCVNFLPCTWAALIYVFGSTLLTHISLSRASRTDLLCVALHSPSLACTPSACSCAGQVSLNTSISLPVPSEHTLAPRQTLPQFPCRQGSNLAAPAPQYLWKLQGCWCCMGCVAQGQCSALWELLLGPPGALTQLAAVLWPHGHILSAGAQGLCGVTD